MAKYDLLVVYCMGGSNIPPVLL